MLSNIVSEVVQGIQVKPLVESRVATPTPPTRAAEAHKMKETRQKMNSRRKELMESIGKDAYNGVNLFEGTAPLTREENAGQAAGSVDLGSSRDAGVDISSLVGGASHVWNAMK
jgi:hypothetical protein